MPAVLLAAGLLGGFLFALLTGFYGWIVPASMRRGCFLDLLLRLVFGAVSGWSAVQVGFGVTPHLGASFGLLAALLCEVSRAGDENA